MAFVLAARERGADFGDRRVAIIIQLPELLQLGAEVAGWCCRFCLIGSG